MTTTTTHPDTLLQLVQRYDREVFELGRRRARIRLVGAGPQDRDVVLDGHAARLEQAGRERPDAVLSADAETWAEIAEDVRGGMAATARVLRAGSSAPGASPGRRFGTAPAAAPPAAASATSSRCRATRPAPACPLA